MICWYKYRSTRGVFGEYQADTADVRNLIKWHRNLYWIVIKLEKPSGNEYWIWSAAIKKWYKKTEEPYWCKFQDHDFYPELTS